MLQSARSSTLLALQAAVAAALGLPILFTGCGSSVTCDAPTDRGDGLEACGNGLIVRTEAPTCDSTLPRAEVTCSQDPMLDACSSDADCTASPNGHCESTSGFDGPGCVCTYGCTKDADCGAGAVCICGDPVGHCESATCATNDDCEDGQLCGFYESVDTVCYEHGWACTTSDDACTTNADCETGFECIPANGVRVCRETQPCAIGRPFLIDDAPRLAPVRFGDAAWSLAPEGPLTPGGLDAIGEDERANLAARWTEIGLMEHASVAAFARFALELLALGAPPQLLVETHAALADETRHARIAFALASAYGGQPIGPGPLSIAGALAPATDPLELLRTLFHEGCVGETVAALEAAEGAARCEDPVIARVLEGIAADESRHAALAWSTVRWLVERTGAEGVAALEEELTRAEASTPGRLEHASPSLARHGHVSELQRAALRQETLRTLVRPAIEALRAQHLSENTSSSLVFLS